MPDKKRIKELREATGLSAQDCIKAIKYEIEHEECTALGYLKAKSIAIATPNMSFEERVRMFSRGD